MEHFEYRVNNFFLSLDLDGKEIISKIHFQEIRNEKNKLLSRRYSSDFYANKNFLLLNYSKPMIKL